MCINNVFIFCAVLLPNDTVCSEAKQRVMMTTVQHIFQCMIYQVMPFFTVVPPACSQKSLHCMVPQCSLLGAASPQTPRWRWKRSQRTLTWQPRCPATRLLPTSTCLLMLCLADTQAQPRMTLHKGTSQDDPRVSLWRPPCEALLWQSRLAPHSLPRHWVTVSSFRVW